MTVPTSAPAVERAVVVCRSDTIRAEDLSPTISRSQRKDGAPVVPGASLFELERYAILKTLEQTGGSTSRAADILGISTRKIQYRLHEYQNGHSRPRREEPGAEDPDADDETPETVEQYAELGVDRLIWLPNGDTVDDWLAFVDKVGSELIA